MTDSKAKYWVWESSKVLYMNLKLAFYTRSSDFQLVSDIINRS